MFGTHFYHKKIRKAVDLFGALFNNINIIRTNSSNQVISQVKVPLSYAPKNKYLERIRENPDLVNNTQVAIKLPRMSFEITNILYDGARQLPKINNFNTVGTTNSTRQKFFAPVPYTIGFQLNIYAKNQDDALQVVEQILPTFNPQYSVTIKPFSTEYPDFKEDIPIAITGVTFTDDYEGPVESRRTIIYTLDFDMKLNLYGPINDQPIIRKAIVDFYDINRGLNDSDVQIERMEVTPTPTGVSPDSDFGFNTDIDIFQPFFPYVLDGYVDSDYFLN